MRLLEQVEEAGDAAVGHGARLALLAAVALLTLGAARAEGCARVDETGVEELVLALGGAGGGEVASAHGLHLLGQLLARAGDLEADEKVAHELLAAEHGAERGVVVEDKGVVEEQRQMLLVGERKLACAEWHQEHESRLLAPRLALLRRRSGGGDGEAAMPLRELRTVGRNLARVGAELGHEEVEDELRVPLRRGAGRLHEGGDRHPADAQHVQLARLGRLGQLLGAVVQDPVERHGQGGVGPLNHDLMPEAFQRLDEGDVVEVAEAELEDGADDPARRLPHDRAVVARPRPHQLQHQRDVRDEGEALRELDHRPEHTARRRVVLARHVAREAHRQAQVHLAIRVHARQELNQREIRQRLSSGARGCAGLLSAVCPR
mmetsp:Transcript_281/g.995  ORF Transcript_281/g.995 Transcript_281/m.995 type:complete len:377 (-) Transcript_281:1928-3058(-)